MIDFIGVSIYRKKIKMDILTIGWAAMLALFAWSISMVVWARNGF